MEPEGSSPCSQQPAKCNISYQAIFFYGDELLAPRPTTKLDEHPLPAVRDCLFNKFAAILHIWRLSPPSATRGRAMPCWDGPTNQQLKELKSQRFPVWRLIQVVNAAVTHSTRRPTAPETFDFRGGVMQCNLALRSMISICNLHASQTMNAHISLIFCIY
jgi:hypothetical protein